VKTLPVGHTRTTLAAGFALIGALVTLVGLPRDRTLQPLQPQVAPAESSF
jgi:hypothetical protein